jgi:PPM family protein phosphatase
MHLKLTAADKSDVGKQRDQNEDCAYQRVEPSEEGDRGLFIVADGMGGYKAGEVASRLAVETISKTLDSFFKPISDQATVKLPAPAADFDPDAPTVKLSPSMVSPTTIDKQQKTRKLPETPQYQRIEEQLKIAVEQANKAILQYGEKQSSARGLGCTLTAALIHNDKAYIANVGDSRTYLFREDTLLPITRDHSLVARLVESKQIEPEDVYTHPQRNLIYRSLGAGHKNIEVDIFHQTLLAGDLLLLCSDGLWEMVRDEDLRKVLSEKASPQQICNTLIDMANANGGEDNISAVVVQINEL